MAQEYLIPDNTVDTGSVYKAKLDANASVVERIAVAFAPHAQSTPDMTVRIDAGYVLTALGVTELSGQTSATIVAPTTNPRIDRVVIDRLSGTISIITGVEAASPVAPDIPSGKAPCCQVLLDNSPATTSITASLITDERVIINYSSAPTIVLSRTLVDSAKTFVVGDMNQIFVITPTVTRILTLPTTSVQAGDMIEIHNLAASQKITIEASGGADIASFQAGSMKLVALQATPTLDSHWRILDVYGGASPSFRVVLGSTQLNITAIDKVEFDTEDFDTNNNYDSTTLYRFTPTIPGGYLFIAQIEWVGIIANDVLRLFIYKNGTVLFSTILPANNVPYQLLSFIDIANGSGDYYEIFAQNSNRDTSDLPPPYCLFSGSRLISF